MSQTRERAAPKRWSASHVQSTLVVLDRGPGGSKLVGGAKLVLRRNAEPTCLSTFVFAACACARLLLCVASQSLASVYHCGLCGLAQFATAVGSRVEGNEWQEWLGDGAQGTVPHATAGAQPASGGSCMRDTRSPGRRSSRVPQASSCAAAASDASRSLRTSSIEPRFPSTMRQESTPVRPPILCLQPCHARRY